MTSTSEKLWSRDFVLFTCSTVVLWLSFYFLLPTLPIFVVQVLGGSQTDVGLLSAVVTLSALLTRPLAGFAVDRWGRRWIHLAFLALFCAVVFSYTCVRSLAVLFLVRMLQGIPFAVTTTASSTVAADLVPAARRGEGIGYFAMAQTLAMAFGPALALGVLGNGQFKELFLATGMIAVGALALALLVRYPAIRDPSARLALRSVLERRVGWVSLTALFCAAGYGAVVTFITLYATELGIQRAGLFFSVYAAGLVLTRAFSGRVLDRYGPRWVVGAGLGISVVGYVLLAMWRVEAGFLSSAFLLGLGMGVLTPSLQTMAVNLVPAERRGAANGTLYSAMDMGIGFGSYALGALGQASGSYGTMYFAAAGAVLVAALLFFGLAMPKYKPQRDAQDQVS